MAGKTVSGGRQLKQIVFELLCADDVEAAMAKIEALPHRRVINALISRFCDGNDCVRWRAILAAGRVVAALGESDMESARNIMRRYMWMLNDESGGIGWGVPEAMGETMARSRWLADEYAVILCSYIHPDRNFLEHPVLQQGLLWSLGRLAQVRPVLIAHAAVDLLPFFKSIDPVHRGYAAWISGHMQNILFLPALDRLKADDASIPLFDSGHLARTTVGRLAVRSIAKILEKNRAG